MSIIKQNIRLISIISLILFSLVFISGSFIFKYEEHNLLKMKELNMKAITEDYSQFINNELNQSKVLLMNTSELISHNFNGNLSTSKDVFSKVFFNTIKSLTFITSVYFIEDKDGTKYTSSDIKNPQNDLRKRKWYIDALNSNEVIVSDVYNDINNNEPVITLSYQVKYQNKILGVIASDIFLKDLNKNLYLFSKSHNLENYMLDGNGTIMLHEKKDLIGFNILNSNLKSLNNIELENKSLHNYIDLWEKHFSKKDSGMVYYTDINGNDVHAYFKKIVGLNWTLVCKIPEELLFNETFKYSLKLLFMEVILFILLFIIGYKFFEKIYYIDKLTALFNKNYLIRTIKKRKNLFDEQHMLLININKFSLINSTYGNEVRDAILKNLAQILTRYIGTECYISRLDSDNFLCLFKENIWQNSIQNASMLHSNIKKLTFNINTLSINTTLSVGIFNIKKTQLKNIEDTISLIESIFKNLKQKNSLNLIICPNIDDIIKNKNDNNKKLKFLEDAINEDKLVPFFQPIIDLNTMSVNKYEVLMRIDNNGKYLSPYPYILLAEEHNMISTLDLLVIKKALKYKSLVDEYDILKFSINLSGKELGNNQYIYEIIELIDTYNISHKNITFEITETQNIENIDEVSKLVKEIKVLGFKFAIDDFGTGFSSMHYLKVLPVDYIKIDGSFIKDILDKKENEYLVTAMVNMAKAYKVKVIAEFVENEAILNKIKKLGIDYGQGYFIGMPNKDFIN